MQSTLILLPSWSLWPLVLASTSIVPYHWHYLCDLWLCHVFKLFLSSPNKQQIRWKEYFFGFEWKDLRYDLLIIRQTSGAMFVAVRSLQQLVTESQKSIVSLHLFCRKFMERLTWSAKRWYCIASLSLCGLALSLWFGSLSVCLSALYCIHST